MLPPKKNKYSEHNYRYFKITGLSDSLKNYNITYDELLTNLKNNKHYKIRVRIHGNHSLTGFGKSFQQYFKWDGNKFVMVNK